jgi:hypothetical protein
MEKPGYLRRYGDKATGLKIEELGVQFPAKKLSQFHNVQVGSVFGQLPLQ